MFLFFLISVYVVFFVFFPMTSWSFAVHCSYICSCVGRVGRVCAAAHSNGSTARGRPVCAHLRAKPAAGGCGCVEVGAGQGKVLARCWREVLVVIGYLVRLPFMQCLCLRFFFSLGLWLLILARHTQRPPRRWRPPQSIPTCFLSLALGWRPRHTCGTCSVAVWENKGDHDGTHVVQCICWVHLGLSVSSSHCGSLPPSPSSSSSSLTPPLFLSTA